MLLALRNWLITDAFPIEAEPLEVLPLADDAASADLVSLASNTLRAVETQIANLQAAADRKRAIESTGPATATGGEAELRQLSKALLPSLDALDRIIDLGEPQALSDENFRNWLVSVKGLRTRVTKTLEGVGLHAISSVGQPVDLELHDVVAVVPAADHPVNTVVAEQQRGYYFRSRLLRDAKVVVAQ
ncbi:nucleotide exchange factor GrpE [Candidatus Sumerlaeota bacterium]|nr:nucleotide exchange factor GrpE [Candidatus Sumerlaeota bacterium]